MASREFLRRIQESSDDTKRIWTIAGTAVVMAVIVFVWLTWFNNLNTLAGVPGSPNGEGTAAVSENVPANSFTFWDTVKSGGAALGHGVMNGLRALGGVLQTPKDYIVKPPQ